jgi:tripartite-type tricarboxylate transporter receptor subunit TctC
MTGESVHILRPHVFTIAVLATVGCSQLPAFAQSRQAFPTKPIRIVISTTAGSQPDGIVRLLGQKMSERSGFAVVVDNRPVAGGTLAATVVAKAAPDGHTLLYVLPNFVITPAMQSSLPYDPFKDFIGASHIGISTNVVVAAPALGVKSVAELIALAKTRPGKLIFATGATGSAVHLSGARFNHIAGIKVVHVAYKGGPEAAIEMLAGRAHYSIATMGVALPFVKEGKMVALAVTSLERTPVLPEVPTLGETMSEFKRPDTSHGLVAPAGTPPAILKQISQEVARILDLPDVKERMAAIGFVAAPSTPDEYHKILRMQLESMYRLVGEVGLRAK